MQWINENLPRQISDPEDLWRAYEALAKADVYMGRIVKSGSWDLLPYVIELMTAGVSLAIRKDIRSKYRWVKYSFPQKILILAKTKEVRQIRDDLAAIIARHLHISKRVAKSDVIPYLKAIFELNPKYAAALSVGLNLSDSMIKYLSPKNANLIIKLANSIREEIRKEAVKHERKVKVEEKIEVTTKEKVKERPRARKKKERETKGGLEVFFKK